MMIKIPLFAARAQDLIRDARDDGAELVILTARAPEVSARQVVRPLLMRAPVRCVPEWSYEGRPHLTKCYAGLRARVLEEGLGFRDADTHGKQWLLELNDILFATSNFHDNIRGRGIALDPTFNFAKGLKQLHGRREQQMTAGDVREATGCV